ncbi:MAG: hypothetical protein A4E51_01534 [Methanosaeta sp. PtaU1.Bin055]|nr:MAG: hypothetical protein A4E51_01534 [Methanosaeta sp. PtaU1.Bin055]
MKAKSWTVKFPFQELRRNATDTPRKRMTAPFSSPAGTSKMVGTNQATTKTTGTIRRTRADRPTKAVLKVRLARA